MNESPSDCIKAVIEMFGIGERHVVFVDGVPTYEIEIRKYEAQHEQAQQTGARNGHA